MNVDGRSGEVVICGRGEMVITFAQGEGCSADGEVEVDEGQRETAGVDTP